MQLIKMENINVREPFFKMVMFPVAMLFLSSCAIVDNSSVSNLDKNIEAAVQNAKDKGYPDLTKIPQKPSNMRTDEQWSQFATTMDKQLLIVTDNPNGDYSHPNTPTVDWAQTKINQINKNPNTAPAPQEDIYAWAARLRAMTNSPKQ